MILVYIRQQNVHGLEFFNDILLTASDIVVESILSELVRGKVDRCLGLLEELSIATAYVLYHVNG